MLKATFELYRDSAVEASKGTLRTLWALVALVVGYAAITVAGMLLAPFGIVGGFVLALIVCGAVGWVLALVEVGVVGRRNLRADDLREALGTYLWEVLSVLFIFFIAQLLLTVLPPVVTMVAVLVCTIVFNPAPEMIYQEHKQSLALLQDAASFMQHNWPEWLGGQLIGAGFLAAWGVVFHGVIDVGLILSMLQAFGPWFGFIQVGVTGLQTLHPMAIAGSAAMLLFTQWFLLFRGQLYKRLRGSSRRGRAWRSRF